MQILDYFKLYQIWDIGGAETGCLHVADHISKEGGFSAILTSGGKLLELIDDKKIKIFKWPVNKNIFFYHHKYFLYFFLKSKFIKLIFYMQEVERQHGQHFLRLN